MDGQERSDWSVFAEAELADVIELRRAIHADPEIGLHCPRTSDKIRAALAGLPLEIREGTSTTGFVAILRGGGGNGRTVLLRGDMDALPMQEETGLPFTSTVKGAMHACGHDAHTAMLVGAAKALSARRETLPGTIVFMFQPGEEGYHGARYMIEDGLLDDPAPEAAFALHISPNAPIGTVVGRAGSLMASTDTLTATIHGRGGHAAMPHDCLDPVPVACEIVLALQTFLARQVPVSDPAVLTIAQINAGSAHNIIPSTVEMVGTLRTLSESTRAIMREGFTRIVENIAAAHGATAEAHIEPGYPVTICDPRATEMMKACANDLAGERGGWRPLPAPMMGAEDFSYVLQKMPGAMAFLGVAPKGSDARTNPPLHNTQMTIDEDSMALGVAMHCTLAERYLEWLRGVTAKEHDYTCRIEWTGNRGEGTRTYRSYDRRWDMTTPGKPAVRCSNDPLLGGDPALYSPEDLLLSALSSCHMLWYLHLASSAGIVVQGYADEPLAIGENEPDGTGRFVRATLRPAITLAAGSDLVKADAIHADIHRHCFIARSVNFPVAYEATYNTV